MTPRRALEPYTGPFGPDEARHLLARAAFGASPAEVARAVEEGLEATVKKLFRPDVAAEKREYRRVLGMGRRLARQDDIGPLQSQWLRRMIAAKYPLHEKVALFWHEHFATAYRKVRDAIAMYDQNALFLDKGLGKFPDLLAHVARDPAMLLWLDGNTNTARAPNENFARELFELFTLGIGNYSERDIKEAARAFTGWTVENGIFRIRTEEHDRGMKTVLGTSGRLGGDDVLSVAVRRPACPRHVSFKLWRRFGAPDAPETWRDEFGAELRNEGFDVGRLLARLFGSRAFFSEVARGRLIRSPVDLVVGAMRSLEARCNTNELAVMTARMGQELYEPPNVAGWPGGRAWINSATLVARQNFAAAVGEGPSGRLKMRTPRADVEAERLASVLCGRPVSGARLRSVLASARADVFGRVAAILTLPEAQLS